MLTLRQKNSSVLIVSEDQELRGRLKRALNSIGIASVSFSNTHVQAVQKIKERNFDIVLFDARKTDQTPHEFVKAVIQWDQRAILIPISAQPKIDNVFGLLAAGARGYIVLPFTSLSLEAALESAQNGQPLSEAILFAPDRNAALVGLVLNSLYRLSVVMRQAKDFSSAAKEVEKYKTNLKENIEIAKIFCEGPIEDLQQKIYEACLERSTQAATRIGRTRKKLKDYRQKHHSNPK